ncbi:MAG: DUF2019 domain-containing protein [Rhizobiales bacterium]|nr:DUF2019 domain-containing protein [Hyphomicrobiales bacterium]
MSVDQLVARFTDIAVKQGRAADHFDNRTYNRLYVQMMEVADELKQRAGDQRRALMVLYEHPHAEVRMMVAYMTLAIAYQSARGVLQLIVDRKEFPQALTAGMSLDSLDRGTYKPT